MGYWDDFSYNGIIRRAKKKGLIDCESDLEIDDVAENVVKYEQDRVNRRRGLSPATGLPLLALPFVVMYKTFYITRTEWMESVFIPAIPERIVTWYAWNGFKPSDYGQDIYGVDLPPSGITPMPYLDQYHTLPIEIHRDAIPEHTELITHHEIDAHLDHPGILTLATAIPFATMGALALYQSHLDNFEYKFLERGKLQEFSRNRIK